MKLTCLGGNAADLNAGRIATEDGIDQPNASPAFGETNIRTVNNLTYSVA
jgi:hypothetical protein